MATQKQITANRENARRSTGPRTEQGKRVSRINALKHGIDAREEISCGESPLELHELASEYDHKFQPVGVLIASKTKDGNEYGAGFTQNIEANNRLRRHMVDTERAYFRYLEELEHRQADRRRHEGEVDVSVIPSPQTENPEIGSVSPEPEIEPEIAPGDATQDQPEPLTAPFDPLNHAQSQPPTPIRGGLRRERGTIYCDLRV